MQRVLENLIENALRHTPNGGRITLTLMPESDKVVVKLSDTGCGIPKEALPHVFDRFYQLEKSRQNSSSNAGLGLAIAKRILELHGSPILVDSEVNTGTTFTFFMPVHH